MNHNENSNATSIRVRMAPSPTGFFHVGTARTALFNYLFAQHSAQRAPGGELVLRIEDTDLQRSNADYEKVIYDGMAWLGLSVDEGPHQGGDFGPYRQSERFDIYQKYADELIASGKAYKAYETADELAQMKADQATRKEAPRYNGEHRNLTAEQRAAYESEGRKAVVRFITPEGETGWQDVAYGPISVKNTEIEDFVLMKSDGSPTYNFACVIDDALMQISHVLRGEDGINNTPRQLLIYQALGFEIPRFVHLPFLLGPDRKKLSKRHGATNVLYYRDEGILPDAMFNYLALLGWNPGEGDTQEIFSREELKAKFTLERVNKAAAIFDAEKLAHINTEHLKAMPLEQFIELVKPQLPHFELDDYARTAIEAARERVRTNVTWEETVGDDGKTQRLAHFDTDFGRAANYFFTDDYGVDEVGAAKHLTDISCPRLQQFAARLEALSEWTVESIEGALRGLAEELGIKPADLIHPARMAVSGRTVGPSIFHLLEILGRDRVLRRLNRI
jgi:glutamyl-tRNA synthetase